MRLLGRLRLHYLWRQLNLWVLQFRSNPWIPSDHLILPFLSRPMRLSDRWRLHYLWRPMRLLGHLRLHYLWRQSILSARWLPLNRLLPLNQ
jgi:hypothetical protein